MPNHPQDFSNLSGDFCNPEPANRPQQTEVAAIDPFDFAQGRLSIPLGRFG